MCGWCMEECGFIYTMIYTHTRPDAMMLSYYLQEKNNIIETIKYITNEMKSDGIPTEKYLENLHPNIIICRLIDILVLENYKTQTYDNHLKNELIQQAIICKSIDYEGTIESLSSMSLFLPHYNYFYSINI